MGECLGVRYVGNLPAPLHFQLEQPLGSWQQHVLPPSAVLVAFRLPPHVAFGDALLQLRRLVLLRIWRLRLGQWQLPPLREGVPLWRYALQHLCESNRAKSYPNIHTGFQPGFFLFLFLFPSGSLLGFDPQPLLFAFLKNGLSSLCPLLLDLPCRNLFIVESPL